MFSPIRQDWLDHTDTYSIDDRERRKIMIILVFFGIVALLVIWAIASTTG